MAVESPLIVIAKWSVPFAMVTTVIGGSAWLTSTHNAVVQNQVDLQKLETEFKEHRLRIENRLDGVRADSSRQDDRLSRMEEKLDFIVKIMERRMSRKE